MKLYDVYYRPRYHSDLKLVSSIPAEDAAQFLTEWISEGGTFWKDWGDPNKPENRTYYRISFRFLTIEGELGQILYMQAREGELPVKQIRHAKRRPDHESSAAVSVRDPGGTLHRRKNNDPATGGGEDPQQPEGSEELLHSLPEDAGLPPESDERLGLSQGRESSTGSSEG